MLYIVIALLAVVFTPNDTRNIHIWPNNSLRSTWCFMSDCYTFEDLIKYDLLSELSNTTLSFLPGIHTVRSDTNKTLIVSITSTTNFTLKAANLTEGVTINCVGNVGFKFIAVINVEISGIIFDTCGTSRYLQTNDRDSNTEMFVLLIAYSFNVSMNTVSVKNGNGIGLRLQNVYGYFTLSKAIFAMNTINLNVIIEDNLDNDQFAAGNTTIDIVDSVFSYGHSFHSESSGILLKTHSENTQSFVDIRLINISTHQNIINCSNCYYNNMYIEMNSCTTIMVIENYTSTYESLFPSSENDISNNGLRLGLFSSQYDCQNNPSPFIMNNAKFNRCGIYAWLIEESDDFSSISNLSLSNIKFESAYNALQMNEMSEAYVTVVLTNVSIKNSEDHGCKFLFSDIIIQGSFNYELNKGSIVLVQSSLTFEYESIVKIRYNFNNFAAALYAEDSYLHIFDDSTVIFSNNRGGYSGAIYLQESDIHLYGNASMIFSDNEGKKGGAMAFLRESSLYFSNGNASLFFVNNHANIVGGAIYVGTEYQHFTYSRYTQPSFLACLHSDRFFLMATSGAYPTFHFKHNTAAIAGSAIYGIRDTNQMQYFQFDNSQSEDDLSVLSSDPIWICICLQSKPDCSFRNKTVQLFPGQVFEIEAVAVGEINGTVPTYANARFIQPSTGELQSNEYVQSVRKFCSKLTYTIKSSQEIEMLQFHPSQAMISTCWKWNLTSHIIFHLIVDLKQCPIGFSYNKTSKQCQIPSNLISHGIECDLSKMQVLRFSPKWINATIVYVLPDQDSGVIIHDHCPFDYCYTTKGVQPLDLAYPDQQCAFNRSGILCGACQRGFSHVLGTSNCMQCTKPWTAVTIIALIGIAGITFVIALIFLNITVSVGTINGFIFYANIVRANYAIFFPQQMSKSFLSMFIAWLNLDLGIEVCFYNGLNAYSKTWLQFMFPLYIWFMVITIIVASHYSTRVSRICGNNSVQVLATLFLLSYAKLFRIIVTVFSSTPIVYPDGYHKTVWLYDGNIEYLNGKHIPLFIAALLILILLSIPFTVTLLCIQWLQRLTHLKLFSWVGRIQPLFDAYTGPYKLKHRYWTGLLLVLRACLYIAFSCNILGDPKINLVVIIVVISILFLYCTVIGGVYKSWALNLLNYSFLLNLIILSVVSLYLICTNTRIEPIVYTSSGIAFMLFIAIVIYHLILKIVKLKIVQKIISIKRKLKEQKHTVMDNQLNRVIENKMTYTTIELGEPLLDDN